MNVEMFEKVIMAYLGKHFDQPARFSIQVHNFVLSLSKDSRAGVYQAVASALQQSVPDVIKFYHQEFLTQYFRQWPAEIIAECKKWIKFYQSKVVSGNALDYKAQILGLVYKELDIQRLFSICDQHVLERLLDQFIKRCFEKR